MLPPARSRPLTATYPSQTSPQPARIHTGYEWNKYNQTHYDYDNPPPKVVQGYKFNIFYPDLIDKKTVGARGARSTNRARAPASRDRQGRALPATPRAVQPRALLPRRTPFPEAGAHGPFDASLLAASAPHRAARRRRTAWTPTRAAARTRASWCSRPARPTRTSPSA